MTEIYIKINPEWVNSESLTGLLESLKLKGHIEYTLTSNPLVDEMQKAVQDWWNHLFEITNEKKKNEV